MAGVLNRDPDVPDPSPPALTPIPPPAGGAPIKHERVPPLPAAAPLNTLSMNSPLAGTAPAPQGAAPNLHSNQAVNEALMRAFQPIVPDQINSLLGPAIGNIQGHVNPIAYYQPRQAAPIKVG